MLSIAQILKNGGDCLALQDALDAGADVNEIIFPEVSSTYHPPHQFSHRVVNLLCILLVFGDIGILLIF